MSSRMEEMASITILLCTYVPFQARLSLLSADSLPLCSLFVARGVMRSDIIRQAGWCDIAFPHQHSTQYSEYMACKRTMVH